MKKSWKKKWLEALRSGNYKQTKGTLRETNGKKVAYCCLGVLCDLPAGSRWEGHDGNVAYLKGETLGSYGDLDCGGYDKFGLTRDQQSQLISMNDEQGASFKKIAKYIEKNL